MSDTQESLGSKKPDRDSAPLPRIRQASLPIDEFRVDVRKFRRDLLRAAGRVVSLGAMLRREARERKAGGGLR